MYDKNNIISLWTTWAIWSREDTIVVGQPVPGSEMVVKSRLV